MEYLITFLEGIISFISPCILPMLPIYISYFVGQEEKNKKKTFINSIGFVVGFTIVFVLLGVFAGSLGIFLKQYKVVVNIIFGSIIVLFGLSFMEIIRLPQIQNKIKWKAKTEHLNFFSAMILGLIFAISWTPCVGAFLGSALLMASTAEHVMNGIFMLVCFSLGLGIPFIISALLIEQLKTTFDFIKKHYLVVNRIAGIFLIIIGILMITGYLDLLLKWLI